MYKLQKRVAMRALLFSILTSLFALPGGDLVATYKTDQANSSMTILGTSTLHDWEMEAKNMYGTMDVDLYTDKIEINSLKLSVPVESLKSGKSPMDDNAYKALKYKKHSEIHYVLTSVESADKTGSNQYKLITKGKLTVAGQTRLLTIPITGIVKDNSLALKGSTSFKMSSFGVEPPSFMFGSVTTGDEVTINFNINYKSTQQ